MKDISITDKLSDKNMLDDLKQLLDEELAKPLEERDLDAIKEITDAMVGINDEEIPQPVKAEAVLGEVSARRKRGRMQLIRKWAAVISACFAVCVAVNFYTIRTYGSNVIETVIKAVKSGFSIDLKEIKDMEEPASPVTTTTMGIPLTTTTTAGISDTTTTAPVPAGFTTTNPPQTWTNTTSAPAGMTTTTTATVGLPVSSSTTVTGNFANCNKGAATVAGIIVEKAEHSGITPCYPEYIPDWLSGIELTESSTETLKDSKDMYFTFSSGNGKFDIIIEDYYSEDLMPEVMVPSDRSDYDVIKNANAKGFVIYEKTGCTALFVSGNTVYTLHSEDIGHEEMLRIAESFVPYLADTSGK